MRRFAIDLLLRHGCPGPAEDKRFAFPGVSKKWGRQHDPGPEALSIDRWSTWLDRGRSDYWSHSTVQKSHGCTAKHTGCRGGSGSEGRRSDLCGVDWHA